MSLQWLCLLQVTLLSLLYLTEKKGKAYLMCKWWACITWTWCISLVYLMVYYAQTKLFSWFLHRNIENWVLPNAVDIHKCLCVLYVFLLRFLVGLKFESYLPSSLELCFWPRVVNDRIQWLVQGRTCDPNKPIRILFGEWLWILGESQEELFFSSHDLYL